MPVPADKATAPPLPSALAPVAIDIDPAVPSVAPPVVTAILPLTPRTPASAVLKVIDPLDVSVPIPLVMDTDPPDAGDDSSAESAVARPPDMEILPPVPESPKPTQTSTDPARPKVAAPVVMVKVPEQPSLDVPELRDMLPEPPATPASAVTKDIEPLDDSTP
jgi:hypothetical protein